MFVRPTRYHYNVVHCNKNTRTEMPVSVGTHAEFQMCLSKHQLVAVDCTAKWCGPCQFIGPIFAQLAVQFPQIHFVKVDVDENGETAAALDVQAMPTFVFFHRGKKVGSTVGASEANLRAQIANLAARIVVPGEAAQAAPAQQAAQQAAPPQDDNVLRPPVLE